MPEGDRGTRHARTSNERLEQPVPSFERRFPLLPFSNMNLVERRIYVQLREPSCL